MSSFNTPLFSALVFLLRFFLSVVHTILCLIDQHIRTRRINALIQTVTSKCHLLFYMVFVPIGFYINNKNDTITNIAFGDFELFFFSLSSNYFQSVQIYRAIVCGFRFYYSSVINISVCQFFLILKRGEKIKLL